MTVDKMTRRPTDVQSTFIFTFSIISALHQTSVLLLVSDQGPGIIKLFTLVIYNYMIIN